VNWAVYWEPNDIECMFFRSEEEALAMIAKLIAECDEESADVECNLHWDITLLQVRGEVHDSPDGLRLERKYWSGGKA
jgi:hypothetical protein